MKKKLSVVIVILAFLASFSSTAALAAGSEKAAKKWTFMVFLNCDNNLDRFGIVDLQEMEKAGLSCDVNIVVQIDRAKMPARRYDVTNRAADAAPDDWGLRSKRVADIGEVDMGDHRELVKFVKWSKDNYPAEKYILVIWNHGAGWREKGAALKGISYDDQSKNHITTVQLGEAMTQINGVLGKPVDILAFDACLMQMMEVVYEIRENARFMVGSEESEPGDGWPYDLICPPLVQNPSMSPEELAKLIPQAYAQSYPKKATTQSALDCSKADEMTEAVSEFAAAISAYFAANNGEAYAVKKLIDNVQKYSFREYIDLAHFVERMLERTKDSAVRETGEKVLAVLGRFVIQNCMTGSTPGWTLHSNGLSIYFPQENFNNDYSKLKFSAFRWNEMVKTAAGSTAPVK